MCVAHSSFPDTLISAAFIVFPADAPSSYVSHRALVPPSPYCPQHLGFAATPLHPLLILKLNISSPSARYQPQTRLSTAVSSVCGGLIFQMLRRSIQTAQISLSYLINIRHPHRQALTLHRLIFDD